MYLLQKRNTLKVIEALSLCFCWCCSRPCHTCAHHLCPRCATLIQHRLKPQWAWPFSLLGYFWQKCSGKCHVHVPTAWWLLAKQWSCESTAGMQSTVTAQIQLWQQGKELTLWWDTHLGTQHLFSMECPPYGTQSHILKQGALQIKTDQFCPTFLNETLLFWKEFN